MRLRPLGIGALVASNLLLTFAFQWVVLTRLGAGRATDALFAAAAVPQLITAVASGALGYVLVPLLAVEGAESRRRLGWTLLAAVTLVFGGIVVLLLASAGVWARWLVAGFAGPDAELVVTLARIQLLGVLGSAVTGVQWALLYAQRRFTLAESAPVVAAAASLAVLLWALPLYGVAGAAWAGLARPLVQFALLVPVLGAVTAPDWGSAGLREAWRRFRPLLGANLYYKSDVIADRILASFAAPGLLAVYAFAQQGIGVGHTVLNRAVAAPALPDLAAYAAGGDWGRFSSRVGRLILAMAGVTVAGVVLLLATGEAALGSLMAHRAFSAGDTRLLWLLLIMLAGVWIGGAVGQVTSGGFYAAGDTRTPSLVGVISFTLALIAKILAFRVWGLWGVAAVASGYYLVNAIVLGSLLRLRLAREQSR